MSNIQTIDKIRYLKRSNLESEQRIVKEWYRDLISSYGIDTTYFRKELDFYKTPSGLMANYTYGESPTSTYYLSGSMVVYMEMMGDAFLLNKFGIETDGDAAVYFTIEDFTEQYRDQIGTITSANISTTITSTVSAYSGLISGLIDTDALTGVTSANITFSTSGDVSGSFDNSINVALNPVNDDIKLPNYYAYGERATTGTLNGTYSGTLDASGNGDVSGNVSGWIYYFIPPAELAGPDFEIAPQVGDFFRIDFEPGNNEEYIITRIHDRNLQTDGLNPLIGKYIWRCDAVRRDPSYETVIGDDQEEPDTRDDSFQNNLHETVSNDIFNYETEDVDDVDGTDSDAVYGNY